MTRSHSRRVNGGGVFSATTSMADYGRAQAVSGISPAPRRATTTGIVSPHTSPTSQPSERRAALTTQAIHAIHGLRYRHPTSSPTVCSNEVSSHVSASVSPASARSARVFATYGAHRPRPRHEAPSETRYDMRRNPMSFGAHPKPFPTSRGHRPGILSWRPSPEEGEEIPSSSAGPRETYPPSVAVYSY